jgi:hypothetical protein
MSARNLNDNPIKILPEFGLFIQTNVSIRLKLVTVNNVKRRAVRILFPHVFTENPIHAYERPAEFDLESKLTSCEYKAAFLLLLAKRLYFNHNWL